MPIENNLRNTLRLTITSCRRLLEEDYRLQLEGHYGISGDREMDTSEGEPEEITYAWTRQAVDTVQHICLSLDELVAVRVKEFEALIAA